jgi:hypothetical protein
LIDKAGRAALQPLIDRESDDGRIDVDQSMSLTFIQKLLGAAETTGNSGILGRIRGATSTTVAVATR